MRRSSLDRLYYYFMIILSVCSTIYSAMPEQKSSLSIAILSKICAAGIVMLLVVFIFELVKYGADLIGLVYVILIMLVGMSFFLSPGGAGSIVPTIGFLFLPTVFIIRNKIHNLFKMKKIICFVFFIKSIFFAYSSTVDMRIVKTWKLPFLLGYSNPNATAMLLFFCVCGLVYGRLSTRKFWCKRILEIDIAYMTYLMIRTLSRTVLVVVAAVFLMFIVLRVFSKFNFEGIISGLALAAPVLYIIIALAGVAVSMAFRGEDLFTGRENIYLNFLKSLSLWSFFLGDFGKYSFANMHNGYLSIIATIGVLGIIPYAYILIESIKRNCRSSNKKNNLWARCCFLGIIIYSSTEGAIFTGGQLFTVPIGLLYILSAPFDLDDSAKH